MARRNTWQEFCWFVGDRRVVNSDDVIDALDETRHRASSQLSEWTKTGRVRRLEGGWYEVLHDEHGKPLPPPSGPIEIPAREDPLDAVLRVAGSAPITGAVVRQVLGVARTTANHLLSGWHKEQRIRRASKGVYVRAEVV